ncbi:unnamed protein product [Auanema sp. JU1783]|nr:unnamed protein product [Auanema sp. JU1783]
MRWLISIVLIQLSLAQVFNIPLPFGGLGFKKTDDGKVEIVGGQDVNLFGWGGRRNVKVVAGNGTFNIQKEDAAYVNGSEYGGANSFEFDKQRGIDVGTNLTLANQKAVGGLGKELGFLEGLFSALRGLGSPLAPPVKPN